APRRRAVRPHRPHARRHHLDSAGRRFLHLADPPDRSAQQGDVAAGDRRTGGLRSRHWLLRRRQWRRAPAAELLLPGAGPDPRGRAPARHRHRAGSRPAFHIRPGVMGREDMRVLVLAGGLSYEREVSLRSGRRILDALLSAGVDAAMRDVDASLLPVIDIEAPDAIIIALHGSAGEDGSLQGILELASAPYVGAGARSARLASDKPSAKAVLGGAGIDTPDWV